MLLVLFFVSLCVTNLDRVIFFCYSLFALDIIAENGSMKDQNIYKTNVEKHCNKDLSQYLAWLLCSTTCDCSNNNNNNIVNEHLL